MCLLNRTRVKDYLHDSENWPRSPFNRSNFVRLSSTLRILGFHSNWKENRCRVVLKRCVNVIGLNACASHEILYTEPDELALFSTYLFPSWMMLISLNHSGFERQTRHFLTTIKINWTNPAWHIAWRDCANFSLCRTTCFAGSTSWNQN